MRSPRQVSGLVEHIPDAAERLMAAYWPGPLTMVFPAAEGLSWDLGDARGTVSLRMPAADFLLELVAEVGPLACTGAGRAGEARGDVDGDDEGDVGGYVDGYVDGDVGGYVDGDVGGYVDGDVALYIDGGPCTGPPSTVVDVTRGGAHVLRPGAIASEDIRLVVTGAVGWGRRPEDPEIDEHSTPADIDEEGLRPPMRIAIGSDHAGYPLKQHLIATLEGLGHTVADHGTNSTESVNYPPICAAVGRAVVGGAADRGIVLGGSGQGEQIAANKVAGVRAALCHDLYTARMSREHNDANVLAMGGRIVAAGLADEIVGLWLATEFEGGRHQQRIDQITEIEAARGEQEPA
ncbi:MAG: ribose 5-phosphate isomerase B [Egibacteraceae bacterium]